MAWTVLWMHWRLISVTRFWERMLPTIRGTVTRLMNHYLCFKVIFNFLIETSHWIGAYSVKHEEISFIVSRSEKMILTIWQKRTYWRCTLGFFFFKSIFLMIKFLWSVPYVGWYNVHWTGPGLMTIGVATLDSTCRPAQISKVLVGIFFNPTRIWPLQVVDPANGGVRLANFKLRYRFALLGMGWHFQPTQIWSNPFSLHENAVHCLYFFFKV